jgi:hypothetical protein
MQQRVISDPHGYGLIVVNDQYEPSEYEFAVRGDYPPTAEQIREDIGEGLCMFCIPLSIAFVSAAAYLVSVFA